MFFQDRIIIFIVDAFVLSAVRIAAISTTENSNSSSRMLSLLTMRSSNTYCINNFVNYLPVSSI